MFYYENMFFVEIHKQNQISLPAPIEKSIDQWNIIILRNQTDYNGKIWQHFQFSHKEQLVLQLLIEILEISLASELLIISELHVLINLHKLYWL